MIALYFLCVRFSLFRVWFCVKLIVCGLFYSTSFSHRRIMDRFCGYHRLGCADCAFGSWSDLASVIDRDHFLFVCLGSYHDCNFYSGACYYHSDCRTIVVEGRNGFVVFVCVGRPFSPSVRFYWFASGFFRHGVDHDGSTSCCIFGTRRLVGIRVRLRSIYCLWVLVRLCLFW
jgi:hypothetical protein